MIGNNKRIKKRVREKKIKLQVTFSASKPRTTNQGSNFSDGDPHFLVEACFLQCPTKNPIWGESTIKERMGKIDLPSFCK